jgi:putative phage-type endonuclease
MTQELAKGYLGGSSAAAAAGLNPYCTPYRLWQQLMGEVPQFQGNRFTEWGNRLEPVVRDKYKELHQAVVHVPDKSLIADNGWARATPDGLVVSYECIRDLPWFCGWEGKTARFVNGYRWGRSGVNRYPNEYRCQCAWYCWITGLDRWDLSVLIGGDDYREYRYSRDRAFETMLVDKARHFWHNNVLAKVPPPKVEADERPKPTPSEGEIQERIDRIAALKLGGHHLDLERKRLQRELGEWMEIVQGQADVLDMVEALC